jgi:hypothetical protein
VLFAITCITFYYQARPSLFFDIKPPQPHIFEAGLIFKNNSWFTLRDAKWQMRLLWYEPENGPLWLPYGDEDVFFRRQEFSSLGDLIPGEVAESRLQLGSWRKVAICVHVSFVYALLGLQTQEYGLFAHNEGAGMNEWNKFSCNRLRTIVKNWKRDG